MKTMLVVATVLSVVPLMLSLLMPNWYLGDGQNAVEDPAFGGRAHGRHRSLSRGSRSRVRVEDEEEREPLAGSA